MDTLPDLLATLASLLTHGDKTANGLRCGELANQLAATPRHHWPQLAREGLSWFAEDGLLKNLVFLTAGLPDTELNNEFASLSAQLHTALHKVLSNPQTTTDVASTYRALHAEQDHLRTEINWAHRGRTSAPYRISLRLAHGIPQEYQALCPEYLLARCPICGAPLRERIDTFSLAGMGWWRMPPDGAGWMGRYFGGDGRAIMQSVYAEPTLPSYQASCTHAQGVMYGVNLQGIVPDDVPAEHDLPLGSAVPHLHRPFMALSESRAVLRTLKIGRLDQPGKPFYTVWLVSYFHPAAGTLAATLAPQDPLHRFFNWPYADATYDLAPWLSNGQAFWLDEAGQLQDHGPALTGWRGNWIRERNTFYRLPDDEDSLPKLRRSVAKWPLVLSESAKGLAEFPLQALERES